MTTKRSPKGEGGIYFSKSKNMWEARITVKDPYSGKTKRLSRYASTEKDARKLKTELLRQRDYGSLRFGPNQSFSDYATHYLEFEAPNRCSKTTINDYFYKLEHYVIPEIGNRPYRDIKPVELQELFTRMMRGTKSQKSLSWKSVESIRGLLSGIFAVAESHGDIPFNPVRRTFHPKPSKDQTQKIIEVWTEEEQRDLIFKSVGTEFEAYIYLVLSTGLRIGEATALRWSDIDFQKGVVHVRKTLRRTTEAPADFKFHTSAKQERKKSEMVFNEPKTFSSRRSLQIQPPVIEALVQRAFKQQVKRLQEGSKWNELELVFPNEDGFPIQPGTFRSHYKRFLESIEIRYIRPHWIRHTFAVTLLSNHATIEQVQQAIGHSSNRITKDTYAKSVPSLGHQAIAQMSKLLFPKSDTNPVMGNTSIENQIIKLKENNNDIGK